MEKQHTNNEHRTFNYLSQFTSYSVKSKQILEHVTDKQHKVDVKIFFLFSIYVILFNFIVVYFSDR